MFGFGLVVLLHVALIWAVKSGLANSLVELVSGPMETKLIEEKIAEKEAPPPPKVDMKPLPPPVVIPVDIMVEAAPSNDAPSIDPNAQRRAAPAAAAKADVIVPPRSNPRRPVTQPEYPPTSKRLGEAGVVVLQLTVNEEGKVVDGKIDTSSGFERLDEAALKEALRTWRLLPGTVNGKPVTATYKFRVVFKIENN